jgi:bacillithiol system protein YtxJ
MTSIESLADITQAMEASERALVIIYKHSPICDLSAMAFEEIQEFAIAIPEQARLYYLDVLQSRAASNQVEAQLGVRHESPQVLFIRDRKCLWNASHRKITLASLKEHAA